MTIELPLVAAVGVVLCAWGIHRQVGHALVLSALLGTIVVATIWSVLYFSYALPTDVRPEDAFASVEKIMVEVDTKYLLDYWSKRYSGVVAIWIYVLVWLTSHRSVRSLANRLGLRE